MAQGKEEKETPNKGTACAKAWKYEQCEGCRVVDEGRLVKIAGQRDPGS